MGDRSFIQIESARLDSPIVLYGHCGGTTNLEAVRNVLARTDRVGDPDYLSAQLFFEFAVTLGGYHGELGYGIGSGELSETAWYDNPTIYVNADTGEYTYDGEVYREFVDKKRRIGLL